MDNLIATSVRFPYLQVSTFLYCIFVSSFTTRKYPHTVITKKQNMGTVTSQIRIDYVFEFYDSEPLMDCTCTHA